MCHVLHFNVQEEDMLERTNARCHVLHLGMQEKDILEHTNAKCHFVCTFN